MTMSREQKEGCLNSSRTSVAKNGSRYFVRPFEGKKVCRQMSPKVSKLALLAMSVSCYKEIYVPKWQVADYPEAEHQDEGR